MRLLASQRGEPDVPVVPCVAVPPDSEEADVEWPQRKREWPPNGPLIGPSAQVPERDRVAELLRRGNRVLPRRARLARKHVARAWLEQHLPHAALFALA